MRDRLCDLVGVINNPLDAKDYEDNGDEGEREQHAMVEVEDLIDTIFKEAQSMRKEIALLRMDVKCLGKQNTRFLTSVRRISSIKRDSNALARSIKGRGEGIFARLEKLGTQSKELEEKHGAQSALVRMVRSQYVSVTTAFHNAMSEYNEAEMVQRENCKTRIQRQAEIMGKELTSNQVEEMIETGKWNLFTENVLTDGRTARSALNEIENRHRELVDLESRIREIHDLFFQIALLVEEQGCLLDNIESNVCATQSYVGKATAHVKMAVKYKKANPCRRFFCCCFPCCNK